MPLAYQSLLVQVAAAFVGFAGICYFVSTLNTTPVDIVVLQAPEQPMFSTRYTMNNNVFRVLTREEVARAVEQPTWKATVEEEKRSVEQYKAWLKSKQEAPLPVAKGSMGIVVACRLDTVCMTNLLLLEHVHKTELPIELWMKRGELSQEMDQMLQEQFRGNVQVRYIEDMAQEYESVIGPTQPLNTGRYKHKNFEVKLKAMVMTRFEKVYFVDGDQYLLQKPEKAMATAMQAGTGAVFWHDLTGVFPENPIWELMGVPPMDGYDQESGMVFIDKAVAWRGLYLAAYMNQKQHVYYNLLYGDKDTFFIAFKSLGMDFTWVPYAPFIIRDSASPQSRLVGLHQPDVNGVPLSVHMLGHKHFTVEKAKFGYQVFTHMEVHNPNTDYVDGGLVQDTAQIVPSEFYLGNFPQIYALCVQRAHRLLGMARSSEPDKMKDLIQY